MHSFWTCESGSAQASWKLLVGFAQRWLLSSRIRRLSGVSPKQRLKVDLSFDLILMPMSAFFANNFGGEPRGACCSVGMDSERWQTQTACGGLRKWGAFQANVPRRRIGCPRRCPSPTSSRTLVATQRCFCRQSLSAFACCGAAQ